MQRRIAGLMKPEYDRKTEGVRFDYEELGTWLVVASSYFVCYLSHKIEAKMHLLFHGSTRSSAQKAFGRSTEFSVKKLEIIRKNKRATYPTPVPFTIKKRLLFERQLKE